MDAEENPSSEEERDDGSDASEYIDEAAEKREYTDEAAVEREYTDEEAVKRIKKLNNRVRKLHISTGQNEKYQYGAQYLLQELIKVLSEYDTKFLTDYLDVFKSNNMSAISRVTGDIISTIEMIISKEKKEGRTLQEPVMVVLVSWLCASMLWNAPRVPFARPALHALLPLLTENEAQRVADAWEQLAQPAALLVLSDAVAGAGADVGALGARLLRAAGRVAAAAGDEVLQLRVRGRSLHAGDAAEDLALPTHSKANTVAEIQKVLVISKLHKLFGKDPDNIVMSGSDSQGTTEEVTNV